MGFKGRLSHLNLLKIQETSPFPEVIVAHEGSKECPTKHVIILVVTITTQTKTSKSFLCFLRFKISQKFGLASNNTLQVDFEDDDGIRDFP